MIPSSVSPLLLSCQYFQLFSVTVNEVHNLLWNLDKKRATGYNDILPKILKVVADKHGFPITGLHYYDVIISAMASQITSLTIVYSSLYSGADLRKHQSSESLAFVRGIHRWPVNSPHKSPVTRKCFHLMTSSCINLSVEASRVPSNSKKSELFLVFKAKENLLAENYRPLRILPVHIFLNLHVFFSYWDPRSQNLRKKWKFWTYMLNSTWW